ncbi:MAG: VacJ family lipoprotein [Alphaproteobacteria bacterium]|nr:VacJ family lipoprotein [Alphaproteobacteria bacterium]
MRARDLKACRLLAALALAAALAGCATPDEPYDPLEPVNRAVFEFNQRLDRNAALPAASYYADTVPNPVREHVHNVLANLSGPVTTANYALQGELTYAGEALARFAVNSTIGLAGVFDVATDWGLPERNRDFGLTLGTAGVPAGPYLVIPFGGSSAVRDLAGSYVDGFFSPLRYVGNFSGRNYVGLMRNVVGAVDTRSRNIDAYRDIERNSVDYYATMRNDYLQRRMRLIEQKSVVTAELPDF